MWDVNWALLFELEMQVFFKIIKSICLYNKE